jgi:hypothetical protein
MNKPDNQEANIQAGLIEDLTIREDETAAIKGGPHSNTYTGTTTVVGGTILI